jgi:hypothetical protein
VRTNALVNKGSSGDLEFRCNANAVCGTKHWALELNNDPERRGRRRVFQGLRGYSCCAAAFSRLQMLNSVFDVHEGDGVSGCVAENAGGGSQVLGSESVGGSTRWWRKKNNAADDG